MALLVGNRRIGGSERWQQSNHLTKAMEDYYARMRVKPRLVYIHARQKIVHNDVHAQVMRIL